MYNDMEKLNIDFVYVPVGGSDFKNIKIVISFAKVKLRIEFFSDEEISVFDLTRILEALQKNNFDKLNIDLTESSNCFLYVKEKTYKINVADLINKQEISLTEI